MVDSFRGYKRKRGSFTKETLIVPVQIFAIIGAIATVIAITPLVSDAIFSADVSQPKTMSAETSSPHDTTPVETVVVKKDSRFSLAIGNSVLLHRDRGEDTFTLSELPSGRAGPGLVRVFFNGMPKDIPVGGIVETSDGGCFVLLVSEASLLEEFTRSAHWVFEYRCN